MLHVKNTSIYIAAMCVIVAASNYLVQFPVQISFGSVQLSHFLTWGALTYPTAFLVTDLTNRRFGSRKAHLVVLVGFVLAVLLSIWLSSPRIAIASGLAFLVAQFLDISIFDRLRQAAWWRAPLISTIIGSVLDTLLFFGIAFAPAFGFLDFGGKDASLGFDVPFLGVGGPAALWVSLAVGDFFVKTLVGLAMLVPYRFVVAGSSQAQAV